MDDRTRVLLLDDGELDRVSDVLEFLEIDSRRLQGEEIEERVDSPRELLITSSLRAIDLPLLERPEGSAEPTWLVIHGVHQESGLRRELRDVGAHFVAREDVDDESLRLLLEQILYSGREKRLAPRLPVDASVPLQTRDGEQRIVELVDWTRQAVRVEALPALERGESAVLTIPASLCGTEDSLTVQTTVVRSDSNALVLRFDDNDAETRTRLDATFSRLEREAGLAPVAPRPEPAAQAPPSASSEAGLAVAPERTAQSDAECAAAIPDWESMAAAGDRRENERQPFDAKVTAYAGDSSLAGSEGTTCLGHDLSPDGICLLGLPPLEIGTQLSLALHGGRRTEPIMVTAEVRRSDESSTGLCFVDHDARKRRVIERLLSGQAPLESLIDGHVQPVVISRVIVDAPVTRYDA